MHATGISDAQKIQLLLILLTSLFGLFGLLFVLFGVVCTLPDSLRTPFKTSSTYSRSDASFDTEPPA
jgi:fucose permease